MRPLKGKKLNDILGGAEIAPGLSKYLTGGNEKHILVANIESVPALNALDEILDVPGLDAVLIGSHDLSTSLDIPEQYHDPLFLKTVETIFRKARAKGIGAGIHAWSDLDYQVNLVNLGANMLIHKADIIFAATGLKTELAAIREKLGMQSLSAAAANVNI
jgi:4-hydroxy-2-oxoheptanedioate aldolase